MPPAGWAYTGSTAEIAAASLSRKMVSMPAAPSASAAAFSTRTSTSRLASVTAVGARQRTRAPEMKVAEVDSLAASLSTFRNLHRRCDVGAKLRPRATTSQPPPPPPASASPKLSHAAGSTADTAAGAASS